jgi:hypothetical protein
MLVLKWYFAKYTFLVWRNRSVLGNVNCSLVIFLIIGAEFFVLQFAIQKLKDQEYRTIIFPVVLYGCETWSLNLREERRLRVVENRVFGSKRGEVTGEWRKLHNEELNDLYSLPNIVRVVKWRRMRWVCLWACVSVSVSEWEFVCVCSSFS